MAPLPPSDHPSESGSSSRCSEESQSVAHTSAHVADPAIDASTTEAGADEVVADTALSFTSRRSLTQPSRSGEKRKFVEDTSPVEGPDRALSRNPNQGGERPVAAFIGTNFPSSDTEAGVDSSSCSTTTGNHRPTAMFAQSSDGRIETGEASMRTVRGDYIDKSSNAKTSITNLGIMVIYGDENQDPDPDPDVDADSQGRVKRRRVASSEVLKRYETNTEGAREKVSDASGLEVGHKESLFKLESLTTAGAPHADIYVVDLMRSGYGLPCWKPQPKPAEGRSQGVVPGDVGTYSVDDSFRRLFNLQEDGEEIEKVALHTGMFYTPFSGSPLTKSNFRDDIIAPDSKAVPPSHKDEFVHRFTLSTDAGGILAVLSAAEAQSVDEKKDMETYIVQNAVCLYRYARRNPRFNSGEPLYFVTTCIKGDVWAQAVFGAHRDLDRCLILSRTETLDPNPSSSYKWSDRPRGMRAVNFGDSGNERRKNQTFFLQGFKLAFSESFVSRMEALLTTPSSNPGETSSQGYGSSTSSRGHPRRSGDGSRTLPQGGSEQASGSAKDGSHGASRTLDSASGRTLDEFECSQFPPPSGTDYHPCDIINKMLLEKTGADFALSHDDDWRDAFRVADDRAHEKAALGDASVDIEPRENPPKPVSNTRSPNTRPRRLKVDTSVLMTLDPAPDMSALYNLAHDIVQNKYDPSQDVTGGFFDHGPLEVIPSTKITLDPRPHPFAHGGHADVYKGTMICEGGGLKTVAVKVLRGAHISYAPDKRKAYENRLRREYGVWGQLKHSNVLCLEGVLVSDALPFPGLVSEYKQHGDLQMFMQQGVKFERLTMAQGIACGLQYLHSQNVVHGGLIPPNVLVGSGQQPGEYVPLITDYGKSRIFERSGYTTAIDDGVSLSASPPELLAYGGEPPTNRSVFSFASDVYSFSLVLLQLVTGKVPFAQEKISRFLLISMIINDRGPFRPTPKDYPLLDEAHEFCWPIMQACWKHNPGDRITSKEAYERLYAGSPSPTPAHQDSLALL